MSSRGLSTHLLTVERQRNTGYRITRLYPAAAAILNLFFCAYFEQYLKDDVSGYYLSLFLFLEALLYAVVSTTNFFTVSQEILSKSRIFPVTPSARLLFVLASNFRRPVALALVGSNVFFIIVLLRHSFPHTLVAALLFVAMIVAVEVLLTTATLILQRRSVPTTGAVALLTFLLLACLIGVVVFHVESLLRGIPLVGWTTNGILAARAGTTLTSLPNLSWLVLLALAGLALGRRFA